MAHFLADIPQSTMKQARRTIQQYCPKQSCIIGGVKVTKVFDPEKFLKNNGFPMISEMLTKGLATRRYLIRIPNENNYYLIPNSAFRVVFLKACNERQMFDKAI